MKKNTKISLQCSNPGPKLPLITVVTVAYNAVNLIEETILSVTNQTYPNIEYIIVDGNSNDGTLDIIKKYKDKINILISEPDNGIYDAMNKGIDLAKGEFINFMNAGDKFYNESVIESVFKINNHNQYDLIYGECEYVYSYTNFSTHNKNKDLKVIWKFMPFCHQSLFTRTSILKKYHFSLNNISADHEFLYLCYNKKYKFLKTDLIITSYLSGGESEIKNIKKIIDRWQGVSKITPSIIIDMYYIYFVIKQKVRNLIRNILPKSVKEKIIRIKNHHRKLP